MSSLLSVHKIVLNIFIAMGNLSVPWVLLFAVYFISSNSQLLQVPFAPYERGYAESAQGNINNILYGAKMKF